MTATSLEKQAAIVLRKAGVASAPIPIHLVAQRMGLLVEAVSLGDDVSGVLVIVGDRGVIGYNSGHPLARQRFTIAHEIAHYLLHRTDANLFIDQRYFAAFRDRRSSLGTDEKEREANALAAALLMPSRLVLREIDKRRFDLGDEEGLSGLAGSFQVSVQAMVYRLTNLGVLSPRASLDLTPDIAKSNQNSAQPTRSRR
jgi:Zn-dependent peptidase ImmA (M78 family)